MSVCLMSLVDGIFSSNILRFDDNMNRLEVLTARTVCEGPIRCKAADVFAVCHESGVQSSLFWNFRRLTAIFNGSDALETTDDISGLSASHERFVKRLRRSAHSLDAASLNFFCQSF